MLFNKLLDKILGQTSKLTILRFMIRTNAEMNGREIARAVKLSHVKCHASLKELTQHGLIITKKSGSSLIYKIEKDHLVYSEFLKPLIEKETQVLKYLSDEIIKGLKPLKPVTLAVFGSIAKGGEKPYSDIDLLVIVSAKHFLNKASRALENIDGKIILKFGNQLSPLIITEKDFLLKLKNRDSLYLNIKKDGVVIYGKEFHELVL